MSAAAAPGLPDSARWNGKRVLVTGNTGFKGSWLMLWLSRLGADVQGLALPPATTPNLFDAAGLERTSQTLMVDLRDRQAVFDAVADARPEVVLHLAAQSLVGEAAAQPVETFDINTTGTLNLLEAVRRIDSVRAVVVVTTDKVYRESARRVAFDEEAPLGGVEPYGASKAAAELVVSAYRDSFLFRAGVAVATARAGNVIGGGDWSANRLLPDIVRAWSNDVAVRLRRPTAVRPWQHVLEPLAGYLVLAERLLVDPDAAAAWNFGPDPTSIAEVRHVVEIARTRFGRGAVDWGDAAGGYHEAAFLAIDSQRARDRLGFRNRWDLNEAVARTIDWYSRYTDGADPRALCEADLDTYTHTGDPTP